MVKKIIFAIFMIVLTYFTSFIVMYNETLKSVELIINTAISTEDYTGILAYNDYYINTPQYSYKDDSSTVGIYNAYDENVQTLTIVIVDKNKLQGELSEVSITCNEEKKYSNIFTEYDEGSIAVLTLYQEGDDEFSLDSSCSNENFETLLVKLNDGKTIVDIDDQVGFIDDDTILHGTPGYTIEEIEEIQYPHGLVKPLLLPVFSLWVLVSGLIYVYKKILIKNKK